MLDLFGLKLSFYLKKPGTLYFFGSPLSRRFKISQLLFRTPRVSSNFEEKCIHCLRLRTKKLRVNIEVQSVRSCFCLQPDIASFSDETSSTQLLPPPTIALMKKATKPSLEHSTELSFKWPLKLGLALKNLICDVSNSLHSFLGLVRIASIIILSWRFEPQLRHKENFKQREGYPCGKMGHHHLPLFIRYIIWFVSNWVLLKLPLTEFEQWTFVLVATGLPTCHQQPIRYRFALANATGINDVGEIDHITSKLRNDES